MIKPRQVRVIDLESVVSELPPDRSLIETELDVLRSNHHARRVIEELQLSAGVTNWLSRNWLTRVSAANQLFAFEEPADGIEDLASYDYDRQMAAAVGHGLEALAGSRISVTSLVPAQVDLPRQTKYYGDFGSYYMEYY